MLINLQTIHRPETLHQAMELLKRPGVYPIYGSGAALIREDSRHAREAVDLTKVVSAECKADAERTYLGGCATLTAIAEHDPALGAVIRAEMPLTLRNTLTLGDVLMEAPHNSPLLTVLYGLGARIDTPGRAADDLIELGRWYEMAPDERRPHLVQGVNLPHYPATSWRFAFKKVSRTPADAPIVAAIGFAYAGTPNPGAYAVVCGVAPHPVRYSPGLQSTMSDYKGSAEYRAAMAKVLVEAAIAQAEKLAQG